MSRRILWLLLIPALLLVGGYLFLRLTLPKAIKRDEKVTGKIESTDSLGGKKASAIDLRPLFVERMQQLLKKSSNGLYQLSIGDLKVDVLASTVSLHNVAVKADQQKLRELKRSGALPANVLDIQFKGLVIEGINLDDALTRKTMDYRLVKVVDPVIHVYRYKKQPGQKQEDFSQRFLKEMKKLSINRLVVEGGTIVAHGSNGKTNRLNEVEVHMNDILLDSTTRTERQRFLFAKNATIHFRNYSTQTSDGLYHFKIAKGSITAPAQEVVLQDVSFASPYSREEFMKRQKFAKELFNLSLSSITLKQVDWWMLFNGEEMVIDQLQAANGKLSVYFDRSMPLRSKVGSFPNQLIAKLPLKLNIDQFSLRNLDFSYTERSPLSGQEGTITFGNVAFHGSNFSTSNKKPLRLTGTGLFMQQVPVTTNFAFDMTHPRAGKFDVKISSGKAFDGSIVNSFAMPLGMLKIEKGTLQKLEASVSGDQYKASGNTTLLYNDLNIALLEKEQGQKALDKKNVTSVFANLFVIKNDNPKKGGEPRRATASFQRDPNGGFFMLIWKTILVGVLKTIGAPEKMASKKPATKS